MLVLSFDFPFSRSFLALSTSDLPFRLLSLLLLPFPFLPVSALQRLPRCSVPLSVSRLYPFLQSDFSFCLPGSVLGLLLVSFRPALLRSRSCSTGDCLLLSLSALARSPSVLLSIPSGYVLTTQPSNFPFLFFPDFASWLLLRCCLHPFGFRLFPFRSAWFPVLRFRFSVLGFLFVSFRSSLLRSHSRSTGDHLLLSPSVLFPFPRFLSSAWFRFLLLSFPFLLFPSSGFP